jgi:vanillate O-demethylase monooxygenase subunit
MVRVAERAGLVWVCLVGPADETTPVPPLGEERDARWRHHQGAPLDWACQAARHTENFCDLGHFSILHTRSFGNPDRSEVDHHQVEVDGQVLRFSYRYPGRDYLDPGRGAVVMDLTYEVHLPFTVVLRDINGPGSLIFTAAMPVTPTASRIFWSSWRVDQDLDGPAVEAAEVAILEEDRLIVEGQRPRRLPLDRGAELHLGFDRFALHYRQALVALGYPAFPPLEAD